MIGAALAVAALVASSASAAPEASEITAPGPAGALHGTLLAPPGGGWPVVLIIPGSGPTDRDGNNPMGVKAAPYRLLAEGLAARGIASVRIDKRGMFASASAVPDANATVLEDYVADTRAWIASIRDKTHAPCVWLLGHSEGGLVAQSAAASGHVCGLITISAAGRPILQVMREQLHANPANAPLLADADAAITSLEAGRTVDVSHFHPALQQLFAPRLQGFVISLYRPDPAQIASKIHVPYLIVQGEADLQVGVGDARRLHAAAPASSLVLLPGVNHVLKVAPADDRAANIATYADPDRPLAPSVVDAVAAFVLAHNSKS